MQSWKKCFGKYLRMTVVMMMVTSLMATWIVISPPSAALAHRQAQTPVLVECRVNGTLVQPVVPPGYTWTWVFVANFNHAPLVNQTRGCLAIARLGIPKVEYTIVTCPVDGSLAAPIGGGTVIFDGGGAIRCDLVLDDDATPGMFRMQARPIFPIGGRTYTLVSSDYFAFQATTDAMCSVLTLNSTYNAMAFQHVASNLCGTQVSLGSYIDKVKPNGNLYNGLHRINGVGLGPVSLTGSFSLPQEFSIRIGGSGESFTLDQLIIDPPGHCCSPT